MPKINKRQLLEDIKERTIQRGRGLVCGICKGKLTYEWELMEEWFKNPRSRKRTMINLDIDHIKPKSTIEYNESWWKDLDNLQLTHKSCNNLKGRSNHK